MPSRQEELQAKKARLAELKRQRELRQQDPAKWRQSIGTVSEDPTGSPVSGNRKAQVDELVETLIGSGHDPIDGIRNRRISRQSLTGSPVRAINDVDVERHDRPSTQSASTQTFAATQTSTVFEVAPEQPPKREVITYSKGVQTESPGDDDLNGEENGKEIEEEELKRREQEQESRNEEIRTKLRREIEDELRVAATLESADEEPKAQQRYPLRTLNPDELNAVTTSNDFLSFVERSSKVIERALDDEYDLLTDYTVSQVYDQHGSDEENFQYPRSSRKSHSLRQTQHFWDPAQSRRRQVTDLQFSPHFSELLLASHSKNPAAANEPQGLILLWNVHAPSRPEYTLSCQGSDILSARFSPFHPNLIVGGCYTGQICLWDTRAASRLGGAPVLKTPQSGSHIGHSHPVYSINLIGTPNAHNIITASTDGVVCSWSVDMLTQPQEYLEVTNPRHPKYFDDLAPTCMTFPASDPTFFVLGTEEGCIHPCHRYDRAGAQAGVDPKILYAGHSGPVMSAQFHPGRGPVDLGDLLLTSSVDWSVKLWRVKPGAAMGTTSSSSTTTTTNNSTNPSKTTSGLPTNSSNTAPAIQPLLSIACEDLVYDAQWSPHKPSVFACVTGANQLDIYDLAIDTEIPVARASPAKGRGGSPGPLLDALNKVAWERKRGGLVATAGLDGVVSLFEVGKGLAGVEAGVEEWQDMKRVVAMAESGGD